MNEIELKIDLESKISMLEQQIGKTPLFDFSKLISNANVELFAKLEWHQLSGSVKARAAFGIIKSAIESGELNKRKVLLDASSGNTGIAYATIAKELSIPFTLVLPENASQKRKDILDELGANIIYSSPFEGTDGAQVLAKEMFESKPEKYFYADQYNNEANWKQHFETTGPEIWDQTKGKVTHFAASLGTTGSFVGVGKYLKMQSDEVCLVQMQPDSPMHGLEGWKHLETAKVPGIFDRDLADKNVDVSSEAALKMIQAVYQKFNLKISPSSAASLVGAKQIAEELDEGVVVTIFADDGSKYEEVYAELGIELF
ncbi:MAG: cysteine synthase family protein [Crocinitomicaceae bacterium]